MLGSSNPVRDVALAAAPRAGVVVRSNRGVAGIDGTVSTAMGAALAHDGPTVALLGDLTLLHDTTGLVVGPDEPRPDLTIVVLDDRGGGIFSLLEQGAPEHAAAFERVFGTPHTVDLAALCAAMGVAHSRADPCRHRGPPGPPRRARGRGASGAGRAAGRARRAAGSDRRRPRRVTRLPAPAKPRPHKRPDTGAGTATLVRRARPPATSVGLPAS